MTHASPLAADTSRMLREALLLRVRARGPDRLNVPQVARRLAVSILAVESFLSGARLLPKTLDALTALLAATETDAGNAIKPTETNVLNARALKVTLVLDPAELALLADPSTARTTLTIKVDGRTVTADIAAKSLRRAKAAIAQYGGNGCSVLVQGKLAAGDVLQDAGLVAQPKVAKVAAA